LYIRQLQIVSLEVASFGRESLEKSLNVFPVVYEPWMMAANP